MLHSFPFFMYESASRPAAEAFAVLWLPLSNAHGLKEKTNGFKPNGAPPSEMTCTSCLKKKIQLYSFTHHPLSAPYPLSLSTEEEVHISAFAQASRCLPRLDRLCEHIGHH